MSMNPVWCDDKDCKSICKADTLGGGKCIGELKEPLDHITEKANPMSKCSYDKLANIVYSSAVNQYDFFVDVYLMGEALRQQGLKLPKAIVENLPT